MRFISSPVSMLSVVLVSLVLAGCASSPMANHGSHHGGHHGDSHGPMGMGNKDMMSMCPMHGQMMSSMAPEERKAMMAEHMKAMSPEMRQQHLRMMQTHMHTTQEHIRMMQEVMATLPAPNK